MWSIADLNLFHGFARFGAIFGLFPITGCQTITTKLSVDYKSRFGKWSLVLTITNFLVMITYTIPFYIFLTQTTTTLDRTLTLLDRKIVCVLTYCNMIKSIVSFLLFPFSVPKFINIFNKLVFYEHKYSVNLTLSTKELLVHFSFFSLLVFEVVIQLGIMLRRGEHVEQEGKLGNFSSFQLIEIGLTPNALKYIASINVPISQFSIIYATAFILLFANMLEKRFSKIQIMLNSFIFNHKPWFTKRQNLNLVNLDIHSLPQQIIDLRDIFTMFKNTVKPWFLLLISLETINFGVLMFHTLIALRTRSSFLYVVIPIQAIICVSKLICLTNCGEGLANQVRMATIIFAK